MTRIKIRDVGDYSIYVSEGTKASPLNLVFFLVVLVGCSFAVFAIFNRTVPIDFLFGTAFIVFGLLFLVASPFRSEVYWVSDSYNGPFNIDYIDKIFLGSEIGTFSGIEEYGRSYLGLESFDFNFNIAINSKEWYIDQIHILMMLSAQLYFENHDDQLNFSIFKRPPPLKYRPVGQL